MTEWWRGTEQKARRGRLGAIQRGGGLKVKAQANQDSSCYRSTVIILSLLQLLHVLQIADKGGKRAEWGG